MSLLVIISTVRHTASALAYLMISSTRTQGALGNLNPNVSAADAGPDRAWKADAIRNEVGKDRVSEHLREDSAI
jgi:hypothetical protein